MWSAPETFFLLLGWHALSDYVLQPEYMAKLKRPDYETADRSRYGPWWWWMTAHSLVNGFGVALITGVAWKGLAEAIVHGLTDTWKCRGRISRNMDQGIHVLCKVLWAYWP